MFVKTGPNVASTKGRDCGMEEEEEKREEWREIGGGKEGADSFNLAR